MLSLGIANPITLLLIGLALVIGLWLWRAYREGEAKVLSRDQAVLTSKRLGLSGRPDRMIELRNGRVIPYEMKSSKRLYDNHRLQVGVYLLLVEDIYGKRPPYGVVALKNGTKIKVRNTASLRRRTLQIAKEIRRRADELATPIRVRAIPQKCRGCGLRERCEQRAA